MQSTRNSETVRLHSHINHLSLFIALSLYLFLSQEWLAVDRIGAVTVEKSEVVSLIVLLLDQVPPQYINPLIPNLIQVSDHFNAFYSKYDERIVLYLVDTVVEIRV